MPDPTDEPILVDAMITSDQAHLRAAETELARLRAENERLTRDLDGAIDVLVDNNISLPEHFKTLGTLLELQAQVARLQAESGAMLSACKRADKIIFDTYSNAQKLEWKAIEENCLQAIRILNTVTDGAVADAGSALLRERDDLRDTIRIIIGQKNDVPWREVSQADVDWYVEAVRKLKAGDCK